jgi:hypothetical protein
MPRNTYLPHIFFLIFVILSGLYWFFNPHFTASNFVCYFMLLAGMVLIGGTIYYRLQPPPRQARPKASRFKVIPPGSQRPKQERLFHIPRETDSSKSDEQQ